MIERAGLFQCCKAKLTTLCYSGFHHQPPSCLQLYFPTVYDIKYLMKFCDNLHGGLNKLAEVLQVERIGPQHQVLLLALCLQHPCSAACWQDSVFHRGTSGSLGTCQALGVVQSRVLCAKVLLRLLLMHALHCILALLMYKCAIMLIM